jgi:restriction endonuclease S subunit
LTWTTDGVYAGTIFLRNGKFSMTTHCGALILKEVYSENILLEYVYAYLYSKLKKYAKGEQNKRVTVDIIKNIDIEIPVKENNSIDILEQKKYADRFKRFQDTKNEIIDKLLSIGNYNIDWN